MPSIRAQPVCLDELPTGVFVSASWYGVMDKKRTTFNFDEVPDREVWSLEHYVGSPHLEYNWKRKLFTLCNAPETLAALDAALVRTTPARSDAKRTIGEEEEAQDRKRQRQASVWDVAKAKTSGSDRDARAAKTAAGARKK